MQRYQRGALSGSPSGETANVCCAGLSSQTRALAQQGRHSTYSTPLLHAHAAPQTITDFCRAHPHEFKVVYVSVDVDERWYKAGTQGKVSPCGVS